MAKPGPTLWQMFIRWVRGPIELRYFNPIRAVVGSPMMLDDVEQRDYQFFVREYREYKRRIRDQYFYFADYDLVAQPLGKEEVRVRLRYFPADEPDPVTGPRFDTLLLHLYDEMAYNRELHQVVRDRTGKFEVLQDGEVQEEFWRVNELTSSFRAQVTVFSDLNHDDIVDRDETHRHQIEYWDYWRDTQDEFGQPLRQYLFVEMDGSNGWFQIWRGQAYDPAKVIAM